MGKATRLRGRTSAAYPSRVLGWNFDPSPRLPESHLKPEVPVRRAGVDFERVQREAPELDAQRV